ncbi:hypothetical protein AVEN_266747-1 [Araneus ventricosus]|uniref:Transmembrane protein 19 n=1 Tax=Araneus ventricosus TaxID=182803 RepID=A0A4Y2H0K7_ARAVE|nr:hypothetical protein AVEN_266747-1 [Araneus ventricosus]
MLVHLSAVVLSVTFIYCIVNFILQCYHGTCEFYIGRCIFSVVVSLLVAGWGLKRRSLNWTGVLSGIFVGLIHTYSSYCFLACLFTFFYTSSKATHFQSERKKKIEAEYKEVSLPEVAAELSKNNEIEIVEIRRFVKQNNTQESSPVLVTMLGTRLSGYMKILFTNQRIQSFIDRPCQCTKCYSFMHPSRVCEKTPVCHSCGAIHSGICQVPQKCVNCQGDHLATSKGCPLYIKEQNIMELKCRNHLTTAEARRIYNQSAKVNYASAVKAHAPINDIEGQINGKMEAMLLKMNEKIVGHPDN